MENKVKNLQELSNYLSLELFYSISLFSGSEISLQGKGNKESIREASRYCDHWIYDNTNLIGKFEYNGCNYRVVLTF